MKYKIEYTGPDHKHHIRYYSALNPRTAQEMFKASVAHSMHNGSVKLLNIYQLECNSWVALEKK